ncbi:endonuclease V [bacterium BMS3Abin02]|nr:endonuclease V [bacterium BMS3Abin02]
MDWPCTVEELRDVQTRLASVRPSAFPLEENLSVGGVFVCFPRGGTGAGAAGDPGWAAAVTMQGGRHAQVAAVRGSAGAAYRPGFLALREGPLLAAAVDALERKPDVLIVNATGRDNPRRGGLAVHLGAVLAIPTVGVTHRPLVASGVWPQDARWSRSPLTLEGEVVGYWLRTRVGARPLCVHAGWRTGPDLAVEIVKCATGRFRTPEPLRRARMAARRFRTARPV